MNREWLQGGKRGEMKGRRGMRQDWYNAERKVRSRVQREGDK